MRSTRILAALLVLAAAPLAAEPGLPDAAAVNAALDQHPAVIAAQARTGAARAQADALTVGPHEIVVSGNYVRRDVDQVGRFDEFDAQLLRAVRLPGKARLDRAAGRYGIEAAENMAEDAKHQVALVLAGYWWDWLGAAAEARVDDQAVANYERALAAVRRRTELGDAAQLDVDQAAAALGSARLAAEQTAGRVALARARLEAQFPALALPATPPEVPVPAPSMEALSALREHVLANSHEIAAADAEAQRLDALARRARRDTVADPSFGIRLFSERGGEEKGAGLLFSMPLGGGHRRALAAQASADASAAQAEVQAARFAVRETAEADFAQAEYLVAAWQRSREALDAQMAALTKLRRGRELGEIDLADQLIAERLVHEAFRSEASSRAEAQRAITRLRIDSHQLWLGD